jgi:hypothetical protein
VSAGWAKASVAIVLLLAFATAAQAQAPLRAEDSAPVASAAHVTPVFERAGFTIPRFTLDVDERGRGTYAGEEAMPVVRGLPSEPAVQRFDREFTVSAASAVKIFALAQQLDYFNLTCASNAKNVADTGTRTLRFSGPDTSGSCTYKFSENKTVMELEGLLRGIAETMDRGRELDRLHRYDRLGLDDAMASLTEEIKDGSAREVGTIAPSLRAIAEDADVLLRVRTRAAALLKLVPLDADGP